MRKRLVEDGAPIADIYSRLEERRKAKASAYYERKKVAQKQLADSKKRAKVDKKTTKALQAYGY